MIWERVFAACYDPLQRRAEQGFMGRRRAELLAPLSGRVLEVGAGTGASLAHYPESVEAVTITEPSAPMRDRITPKLVDAAVPVEVVPAPAESLPFGAGEFDHVVCTLVLCTIGDVESALAEVKRVMRPGATLHFIEHGGDAAGSVGDWQRRLDPIWRRVACGCRLVRDTRALLEAAQFDVRSYEEFDPPGLPAFIRPFRQGVAVV